MSSFDRLLGVRYSLLQPEGGCFSCPRRKRGMVSAALLDTQVIVVDEAPSRAEAEGAGDSAADQLMRSALADAGIPRFSRTSAVHCRPPGDKTPTTREVRACLNQFVAEEVRGYPIVVLAGNVAVSAFYPGIRAGKLRGNLAVHPDYPGQRFYTMYHPSYAMRGTRNRKAFAEQAARLGRIVREPADTPWRLVTAADADAWERYERILATGFVSGDLETDDNRLWNPHLRVKSLAVAHDTDEAVFWHRDDPQWPEALEAFARYLEGEENILLAHNGGFDVVVTERRAGCRVVTRCERVDTMHLLYLARQEKQIGLKQATARYGDGYRFLVHAPHTCEDVGQLAAYNSEDVIRPLELFHRFYPDLPARTRTLLRRVSSPTSDSLARVTADGIGYSLDRCRELRDYTRRLRDEAMDAWRAADSRLDLRYDEDGKAQGAHAGEGLREYVYGEDFLALPVGYTTESGLPSVDKNAIKALVRDHPRASVLKHLLTVKQLNKQEETYVDPYLSGEHVAPDGRVHSSYTACWTDTGRPSSRNPNLQNITRPKREWAINVRDCFVPRDGSLMVQWDFSQIELRIAMCLAEDPVGIAAYRSGSDLHTETGAALAALAGRDEPTKKDRTDAKGVNFGSVYGAQWPTVQNYAWVTYGVQFTDQEAQDFVEAFFAKYRRLRPWHAREIQNLRRGRGELTSVMGHTAYYRDWDSGDKGAREHAERAAINMTCQGPAAYITFDTLRLVQRAVRERPDLDVLWTNTVYDSIQADVRPDQVGEVDALVRDAVRQVHDWIGDWFVVPLVVDREEGPDWGHLKEAA